MARRRAQRVIVSDRESASTKKAHAPVRPPVHRAAMKRSVSLSDPLPAPARLRRGPDSPRARAIARAHGNVAANALRPLTGGEDATQAPLQLGLGDGRSARAVAWAGRVREKRFVRARPGRQGQSGSVSGFRHDRRAGRACRGTSPFVTCRPTSSGHSVGAGVRVRSGG